MRVDLFYSLNLLPHLTYLFGFQPKHLTLLFVTESGRLSRWAVDKTGETLFVCYENLDNLKFIKEDGTNITISYTCLQIFAQFFSDQPDRFPQFSVPPSQ